jgi:ferredoxin
MGKVLSLDIGQCNMCLSCVEVCPEVFRETELGFIEIIEISPSPHREIREAIKYCPNNCIKWNTV